MINYQRIAIKTFATTILAIALSLLISSILVPPLGGKLAGAGLIMTIVCPLAVAAPVSALHHLSSERLRIAKQELISAHEELKKTHSELLKNLRRDYLTETLNRQAFFERLSEASDSGEAGGLLFIDLDHFKAINDTHGHATGDYALRKVGLLLSNLTKNTGFVGRLGGEEFSVFISTPDPKQVTQFAETIRQKINSLRVIAPNNLKIHISASIGISICQPGFNLNDALLEADEKMYIAKDKGRNLIVS